MGGHLLRPKTTQPVSLAPELPNKGSRIGRRRGDTRNNSTGIKNPSTPRARARLHRRPAKPLFLFTNCRRNPPWTSLWTDVCLRTETNGRDDDSPERRLQDLAARSPNCERHSSWTSLWRERMNKSGRIQNPVIPPAGRCGAPRGGAGPGRAGPGRVGRGGCGRRSAARRGAAGWGRGGAVRPGHDLS